MQETDKFKSYVGFAIKSGKVLFGADTLLAYRKKVRVIIVSPDTQDNTLKKVTTYANDRGITLLRLRTELLENIVYKTNCKVIGVTDFNLGKAIIGNFSEIADRLEGGEHNE